MEQTEIPHKKVGVPHQWLHYLLLGGGDLVMIFLFAALGRRSHGEEAGLAALAATFATAVPFLVGWLIVAPVAGAYRITRDRGAKVTAWDFVMPMLRAWLLTWPIALMLRSILLQREIMLSFALVTLVTNTVLLGAWRLLFGWWRQRNT